MRFSKYLCILVLLLIPLGASAQGIRYDNVLQGQEGVAIAGANVEVCSTSGNNATYPCSVPASIYSNQALTTSISQPQTTSSTGSYGFWAAPGHYVLQIWGAGVTSTSWDIFLPCDYSATAGTSGACSVALAAGNGISITGSLNTFTITNNTVPATSDGVQYVSTNGSDSNDGLSWGTAKLTLSAAETALSSGGIIHEAGTESISAPVTTTTADIRIECVKGAGFTLTGTAYLGMNGSNDSILGCSFSGSTSNAAVSSTADGFSFLDNSVTGFSTTNGGNGELEIYSGDGDVIASNSFSNNVNYDIFGNPNANGSVLKNLRIYGNKAGEIILHATGAGAGIEGASVTGNTLLGGQDSKIEFCIEIESLSTGTVSDVTVEGNTCTLVGNTDGGISIGGGGSTGSIVHRAVEESNTFNGSTYTASNAAFEITDCESCSITGNSAVDAGSVGIRIERSKDSTFVGNVVNGFSICSTCSGIYLSVNSTVDPSVINDTVSGNTVIFKASGAGYGIWQQCNATGATCENISYVGNTVVSDGTTGSEGIRIENDTGTTSGIAVSKNNLEGPATSFSVTGTVSLSQSDLPAVFADYAACASALEGNTASVSDSSSVTFNATITGSGTDHIQGYCNGTNWVVN